MTPDLHLAYTPQPLYNTVHYNSVWDITQAIAGPQMVILRLILLYNYLFYSSYNMDWISNTEIGLDPNKCYKEGYGVVTTGEV